MDLDRRMVLAVAVGTLAAPRTITPADVADAARVQAALDRTQDQGITG